MLNREFTKTEGDFTLRSRPKTTNSNKKKNMPDANKVTFFTEQQ